LFRLDINRVIDALKPYRPTPIILTAIGLGALGALAAKASPVGVVCVTVIVILAYFYWLERRAALMEKELRVDFDNSLRGAGGELVRRLERRLRGRDNADEPNLFSEEADE